jgi:hypothetical protein
MGRKKRGASMTTFEVEDSGKWFELEGGGRLQIRSITADRLKEIRRATVKKRTDFKKVEGTPARFEYEEVNSDLSDEMFWDFIIVDWENFKDSKNKEIKCTKENKMLLISKSPKFLKFLNESMKALAESEAEEANAEIKN